MGEIVNEKKREMREERNREMENSSGGQLSTRNVDNMIFPGIMPIQWKIIYLKKSTTSFSIVNKIDSKPMYKSKLLCTFINTCREKIYPHHRFSFHALNIWTFSMMSNRIYHTQSTAITWINILYLVFEYFWCVSVYYQLCKRHLCNSNMKETY